METVQNAAAGAQSAATAAYNTASKMIFGENQNAESGTEPVSGQQGQGTTGSPFDQGNKHDGAAAGQSSTATLSGAIQQREETGQEPLSGVQGKGTISEPFDQGNTQDGAAAGQSTKDTLSGSSSSGAVSGGLPPTTSTPGVTEAPAPVVAAQGADKPLNEPVGGQQDAVKAPKEAGEEAMGGIVVDNTADGGNDLSGEAIKAKGTGQKYTKSTGLAADGGDFDASKPGAGAEASRLMEEKSVDKGENKHADGESSVGGATTGVEDAEAKPKLTERIKNKLHIHKH